MHAKKSLQLFSPQCSEECNKDAAKVEKKVLDAAKQPDESMFEKAVEGVGKLGQVDEKAAAEAAKAATAAAEKKKKETAEEAKKNAIAANQPVAQDPVTGWPPVKAVQEAAQKKKQVSQAVLLLGCDMSSQSLCAFCPRNLYAVKRPNVSQHSL